MAHRAPSELDEATLAGRANDALQHVLLGEAIDDGPALVFVADDFGGYAAVNKRVCETLGYTRAELLGKRVADVAIDPDAPELYDAMLKSGSASGVTQIRCKDGRLLAFRYDAREVTVARLRFWVSLGVVVEP